MRKKEVIPCFSQARISESLHSASFVILLLRFFFSNAIFCLGTIMHKPGAGFSFKEKMTSAPKPRPKHPKRFQLQFFFYGSHLHRSIHRQDVCGSERAQALGVHQPQRRASSFSSKSSARARLHAGGLADADRANRCPCIARRSCLAS